ncbi:hypothetical protein NWE55_04270 [Myroides albus]|uniref:hypothetical protein n=1 Tax=Myroides albus TaxID=2562892 RepID=UPI002158DCB2|nr:hypothetical protein [Myroides albus]UVD80493.1 hypothetical protein NWE55_04270 [Myroides albus]
MLLVIVPALILKEIFFNKASVPSPTLITPSVPVDNVPLLLIFVISTIGLPGFQVVLAWSYTNACLSSASTGFSTDTPLILTTVLSPAAPVTSPSKLISEELADIS